MTGVVSMLYEDQFGKLYTSKEIDNFSCWEIEEKGLHLYHGGQPDLINKRRRAHLNS